MTKQKKKHNISAPIFALFFFFSRFCSFLHGRIFKIQKKHLLYYQFWRIIDYKLNNSILTWEDLFIYYLLLVFFLLYFYNKRIGKKKRCCDYFIEVSSYCSFWSLWFGRSIFLEIFEDWDNHFIVKTLSLELWLFVYFIFTGKSVSNSMFFLKFKEWQSICWSNKSKTSK